MKELQACNQVLVTQKKEMFEAFTGYETQNRYEVHLEDGVTLHAAEVGSGFLSRNFLNQMRPFEVLVADGSDKVCMKVTRPFRFIFHEVKVSNPAGVILGRVVRRFRVLNRLYEVKDAEGQTLFQIKGPIFKPWTFYIENAQGEVGVITKKWSGFFKEALTDADNFGLKLGCEIPADQKAVLLGAVFLIDFVHFESGG